MQSTKWLALPAALMATVVLAQKPADPKAQPTGTKDVPLSEKAKLPGLEDLLTAALQHSPEVQVAEAKVKEAEAQLRQTRLQVAQRLVDLHTNSETQRKNLSFAEEEFKRVAQLKQAGSVSTGEYAETERKLQVIKGQVAQLEASVATLTGQLPAFRRFEGVVGLGGDARGPATIGFGGGGMGLGGGIGSDEGIKPRWPRQGIADKMFKALEKPIERFNQDAIQNVPLKDLMEFVRDRCGDVPFLLKLDGQDDQTVKINFKGDVTLGSFFEVLTDTIPDLKIFVRDYGFLITFGQSAPDDGLTVGDFWRQRQMTVQ